MTISTGYEVVLRLAQTGELLRVRLIEPQPLKDPISLQRPPCSEEDEQDGTVLVSTAAPLGRALLGKQRGDVVTVEAPAGTFSWEIIDIAQRAGGAAREF